MISEKQLEQWKQQSQRDKEQFKKDQAELSQYVQKTATRTFFQRMRAKFFNFQDLQNEKLNRLLIYAEMDNQLEKYPKVKNAYITYNTSAILMVALCLIIPKKLVSKLLASLITYGIKQKITDGIFTYYMVETIALSDKMEPKEQELRNILEYYYIHKIFRKKIINEEQKKQAEEILSAIRKLNEKYANFKKVQNLL